MSDSWWVVWSEEHAGWWGPGEWGYVRLLRDAGRYSEEHARRIEANANRYLRQGVINEIAMPDPMPGARAAKTST